MKSDWRVEVKALAANARDVLQEHHGLEYVTGSLEVSCAKMWEFYRARGDAVRPARALAEFAYARALDSLTPTEIALTVRGSDEKGPGALAKMLDVAEALIAATGEAATVEAAGQESAALAQALRVRAQGALNSDERTRLNQAAEVFGRAAPLMVQLRSLRRALPVLGCLLPPERLGMEPEPLLGLQEQEQTRELTRDLVRLKRAGVPVSQLAQVWYGENTADNRKRMRDRLRHAFGAGADED